MVEALILSGGFGTRLRPLTFSCPKPIIPFCNVPIMEHQIIALKKVGVTKIILAVSNDPQCLWQLKLFLKNCQKKYEIDFVLSIEDKPLGTAGPIALARSHIKSENFFVLNSDIICCYPLRELLDAHIAFKAEGTIMSVRTDCPWKYGVIVAEPGRSGKIYKFIEKPTEFVSDLINGGIYCLNKKMIDRLPMDTATSIERDIFPKMAEDNSLFSFNIAGDSPNWMDIGQPKDYILGTQIYINTSPGPIIGTSTIISKTAKISKNVVIGNNCVINDNVTLDKCILFDGVVINNNTTVTESIISHYCVLGLNCDLGDFCVLDQAVTVLDGTVLRGVSVCSHRTVGASFTLSPVVM